MSMRPASMKLSRRQVLAWTAGVTVVPLPFHAALATPQSMADAIGEALGPFPAIRQGRVKLALPELAENGNSVPLKVAVESPMTAADHVETIYVFSEKNPVSNVVRFHLGPRCGRAEVQTSIRLAASQQITAIAKMSDGTLWSGAASVVVTQTACLDDT
jgi:sulfur-oxidizing protein SoxY